MNYISIAGGVENVVPTVQLQLSVRGLVLAEGGLRLEALGADRAAVDLVGVVDVQVLVEVAPSREVLSALKTPEKRVGPSG